MDALPSISSRRRFLATTAQAGLILGAPGVLRASNAAKPSDTLDVAIVGFGKWGLVLNENMQNIPGIRVRAVCDIWHWSRARGTKRIHLQTGVKPNVYADLDEMLEKEKGLDAAIIATPDFWHAPHAVRCMEAGLHVYCESMMAHTLDAARDIVRASKRTGMLCQIGHQHRSSAAYRYIQDWLLGRHRICGDIHNIHSQWNLSVNAMEDIMAKPSLLPDAEILQRYGFQDKYEFMNWRNFRIHSQGRIEFFAARQMEMNGWFLRDAMPVSVSVVAGRDVYKDRENFDNLMCIVQYDAPHGRIRAFHQSLSSMNDPEIRHEAIIGVDATIRVLGAGERTEIRNRTSGDDSGVKLADLANRNIIRRSAKLPCYLQQEQEDAELGLLAHESTPPIAYELPGRSPRPAVEAHLANFFDAIRGRGELNCDARTAFRGEVVAHAIHVAAEAGGIHTFRAEDFEV
jgi:predicted dehydrogenase